MLSDIGRPYDDPEDMSVASDLYGSAVSNNPDSPESASQQQPDIHDNNDDGSSADVPETAR